ncbi:MAG TPA: hypothetical protein PKO35_06575 [Candidatus Atribacteria bacterium]|nr:hypothetical protein [Candidatus Atribacteria bacterium]
MKSASGTKSVGWAKPVPCLVPEDEPGIYLGATTVGMESLTSLSCHCRASI